MIISGARIQFCARVRGRTSEGHVAAVFSQKNGVSGATLDRASPIQLPGSEVGISVKRQQQWAVGPDLANEEAEQVCSIFCSVRDLPHDFGTVLRRASAEQDDGRLEYDALLLCPEESEQQQIRSDCRQRGQKEDVTRNT